MRHVERFKLNHGGSRSWSGSLQSHKDCYVTVWNRFAVTVSNWNVNSNCFQMKFQVTALTILHELKFNCWTVPPKRKASFNNSKHHRRIFKADGSREYNRKKTHTDNLRLVPSMCFLRTFHSSLKTGSENKVQNNHFLIWC